MLSVSSLNDLVFPESPEALVEHFTHSDHHYDIHCELVQSLGKESKQDKWKLFSTVNSKLDGAEQGDT